MKVDSSSSMFHSKITQTNYKTSTTIFRGTRPFNSVSFSYLRGKTRAVGGLMKVKEVCGWKGAFPSRLES